nr:hypothetical protein Iba_chr10aCG11090 [Ipomoea batatas]
MTERYNEPMAESLADIRLSVGTSQGNAVHEDCDQQEIDEDKEPEKDNPGRAQVEDEDTHNSMEVESQTDNEPRADDDMFALPLAMILPRIGWSSARGENLEASCELDQQSKHIEEINSWESSSSARDKNLVASRGADHEDLHPRNVNEDILSDHLVEVNLRMSSSLAREGNVEASRSASHEDSTPRNELSDTLHMVDVEVQADPSLARGENLEAPRGASHDDQAQGTQSTKVISSSILAYSSIVSSI